MKGVKKFVRSNRRFGQSGTRKARAKRALLRVPLFGRSGRIFFI